MAYRIRPLDNELDTAGFRCGEAVLDEYLHRYAKHDIKRGVARVFVAGWRWKYWFSSARAILSEFMEIVLRKR